MRKSFEKASLFPEIFDLKVSESKRLFGLKSSILSMNYLENKTCKSIGTWLDGDHEITIFPPENVHFQPNTAL